MGNVNITLHVDTANIKPDNVDECCYLSDSEHDTPTEKPEDFMTLVNLLDTVSWKGLPTNSELEDSVKITEMFYKSGTNLFNKETIDGNEGIVTGKVQSGSKGDTQIYGIKFDVIHDGETKSYSIDPKIRINS
jgi:hypothetical protein